MSVYITRYCITFTFALFVILNNNIIKHSESKKVPSKYVWKTSKVVFQSEVCAIWVDYIIQHIDRQICVCLIGKLRQYNILRWWLKRGYNIYCRFYFFIFNSNENHCSTQRKYFFFLQKRKVYVPPSLNVKNLELVNCAKFMLTNL